MSARGPCAPPPAELDRLLRACIQCGLCLPHCATYLATANEAQSPRGRLLLLGRLVAEPSRVPAAAEIDALDLCLGCRACVTACPSGISATLLEVAKARAHAVRRGPGAWLIAALLSRRGALAALGAPIRWGRAALPRLPWTGSRVGRWVAAVPASWQDADLARLLAGLVARAGAGGASGTDGAARAARRATPPAPPRRVALFRGCASGALLPHAQQRLRALLTAAGCEVSVPRGQACCGALAEHAGQPRRAARQRRVNLAALARDPADVVIVEAAGCGLELQGYPPPLAARARDAAAVLAELPLPPPRAVPLRVAYHDPCHARHGQGIVDEPRALLARIPGLIVVEPREAEVCCGSGGPYALLHPELAARMGRRKAQCLAETGADLIVTGNPGCLGQIAGALRDVAPDLPILPLTDLLWWAHVAGEC